MDGLSLLLAAAVAGVAVAAALLFMLRRRTNRAVDAAVRRIGVPRRRRVSRPVVLAEAVDRIDEFVAHAERDRAQLVATMEHARIGIMAIDDSGVVTFINPVAQRYLGARQGEAIAEARLKEVLDEVTATRSEAVQELELYTPVRRVLRLRAVPADYGVESLGAVLYIEDLTEERRVDAIRRDFVANVGHELKTPLGAMSILAETIGITDDTAVRLKLAERLAGEAKRMATLVGDLLDLSQVESFGVPPEAVPVALVVTEAVGQIRLAAEEAGVDIATGAIPTTAVVSGDRRQLISAVANLLDNAVKYTLPRGDEEPGKVGVTVSVEGDWVSVAVQDQGVGIPESHLDRIFERFYRVDRARSRELGGTGLGLSIVRHVALNHGGEIAVTSEEGVGSTFTLRLRRWKG